MKRSNWQCCFNMWEPKLKPLCSSFTHACMCSSLQITMISKTPPEDNTSWRLLLHLCVHMCRTDTYACIRCAYMSVDACISAGLCTHVYISVCLSVYICISVWLYVYLSILSLKSKSEAGTLGWISIYRSHINYLERSAFYHLKNKNQWSLIIERKERENPLSLSLWFHPFGIVSPNYPVFYSWFEVAILARVVAEMLLIHNNDWCICGKVLTCWPLTVVSVVCSGDVRWHTLVPTLTQGSLPLISTLSPRRSNALPENETLPYWTRETFVFTIAYKFIVCVCVCVLYI